jgi:hypothetical protein
MKKALCAGFVLYVALALVGCGGGSESATTQQVNVSSSPFSEVTPADVVNVDLENNLALQADLASTNLAGADTAMSGGGPGVSLTTVEQTIQLNSFAVMMSEASGGFQSGSFQVVQADASVTSADNTEMTAVDDLMKDTQNTPEDRAQIVAATTQLDTGVAEVVSALESLPPNIMDDSVQPKDYHLTVTNESASPDKFLIFQKEILLPPDSLAYGEPISANNVTVLTLYTTSTQFYPCWTAIQNVSAPTRPDAIIGIQIFGMHHFVQDTVASFAANIPYGSCAPIAWSRLPGSFVVQGIANGQTVSISQSIP